MQILQIYQSFSAVFFGKGRHFDGHLLILWDSIAELPKYHAIFHCDT